MPLQDWIAAAKRAGFSRLDFDALKAAKQLGDENFNRYVQAAQELTEFLESEEGRAAKQLLLAAWCHIVLAVTEPESGWQEVYLLNYHGQESAMEARGMWIAYASPDEARPTTPVPETAGMVVLAVEEAGIDLARFVDQIRATLDGIAAEILEMPRDCDRKAHTRAVMLKALGG